MPPSPEVLIAGAGPAGSALAWHLARAGVRVLLADRAAFPRDKACSEYLNPEAVRLLDRLGLVAGLEQAGAEPLLGTRVIGPRGGRLTGRFAGAPRRPFRDCGLSVARRVLDAHLVLAAQQAGAELLEQVSVEELLYESGAVAGAVLRDRDGRRWAQRARLVVGADGLRSVVARRIGRRRHGLPVRMAFVAHVAGVTGLDGHAEMHVGPQGYVGLNRIGPAPEGSTLANVALVVPRGAARAASGRVEQFFRQRLERFPGIAGRIPRDGVVREVLTTGPFAAWSGRVVTDGALLVGDAADFFDPFTGEGIHSALRGAELAAEAVLPALALGGGIVPGARLGGYARARRAAFLGKWTVERLVGYGMVSPALFDRAVRRLERRGLADTFVGVTGNFVPARTVLNPWFLARMVL